jgi:FtsZ-interacting cell division protein ZipA
MDSSTLTSIIIAILAIVPGVWALVNQARKDKKDADLAQLKQTADQMNANQQTSLALLTPLREENVRLLARIAELEDEKEKLTQEAYDKDSLIHTMKMQMIVPEAEDKPAPKKRKTTVKPIEGDVK